MPPAPINFTAMRNLRHGEVTSGDEAVAFLQIQPICCDHPG